MVSCEVWLVNDIYNVIVEWETLVSGFAGISDREYSKFGRPGGLQRRGVASLSRRYWSVHTENWWEFLRFSHNLLVYVVEILGTNRIIMLSPLRVAVKNNKYTVEVVYVVHWCGSFLTTEDLHSRFLWAHVFLMWKLPVNDEVLRFFLNDLVTRRWGSTLREVSIVVFVI